MASLNSHASLSDKIEYHELSVQYLPPLTDEEKSKAEYSVNGIQIKDLIAERSTFSKEEVRWMIDSLENCKIHAMGVAKLNTGGVNHGFCGAAMVSELNLQGVMCHIIRCIDLNAFTPIMATMVEQQLYPGFNLALHNESTVSFPCQGRQIVLQFKDDWECQKFSNKFRGCMGNLARSISYDKLVSKIHTEQKGKIDPALAATIQAAEQARGDTSLFKGAFLADGLADVIEQARQESSLANAKREERLMRGRGGSSPALLSQNQNRPGSSMPPRGGTPSRVMSQRGGAGPPSRGMQQRGGAPRGQPALRGRSPTISNSNSNAFNQSPMSTPSYSEPKRATRAETVTAMQNLDPRLMPRESKVMKWQQQINRTPVGAGQEVLLKIQLVKLGGTKTMKFQGDTLVSDAVRRIAKVCGVPAEKYGLFRRSGLHLDDDATFVELDVVNNDILDFKAL